MNIKCLIVDDEPLARDLLEGYVSKTPFLSLGGIAENAVEALEIIHQQSIDLLFLDIQMPDLSGIELSKSLVDGPKVIFTTAFEEYALEGFKVDALDYLLKPFNYAEFLKASQKAYRWFDHQKKSTPSNEGDEKYIFVKSDYKIKKIMLEHILYIEGLKDYVKIYLQDDPKPILSLISMKSMEEKLPESAFMRVHRSFIVHLDKISIIERSRIVFGEVYIPVSEKYKPAFQEFLNRRFME